MRTGRIFTPAPINTSHELATGLVGAWVFLPELGGRAWDLSGRGFDATPTNGPVPWVDENGFAAFKVSSTGGEYLDCGNSSTLNLTAGGWMGCSVYFTNTTISGGTTRWMMGRDDNTLGRAWAFGAVNDGRLTMQINGSGTATSSTNPVLTSPPLWQRFFAAGSSTAGWRVYANGANVASGSWVAPNTTTGSTTLGRRTFSGSEGKFNGSVSSFLLSTNGPVSAQHADHLAALDFDEWKRGWPTFFRRVPTHRVLSILSLGTTVLAWGSCSGTAGGDGTGNAKGSGFGTAAGVAAGSGTGNLLGSGFGTAAGLAAGSGSGSSSTEGSGTAAGLAAGSGTGNALAAGFGEADGTSGGAGVGASNASAEAHGSCAGQAGGFGVGNLLGSGFGTSTDTAGGDGYGQATIEGFGGADGTSGGFGFGTVHSSTTGRPITFVGTDRHTLELIGRLNTLDLSGYTAGTLNLRGRID